MLDQSLAGVYTDFSCSKKVDLLRRSAQCGVLREAAPDFAVSCCSCLQQEYHDRVLHLTLSFLSVHGIHHTHMPCSFSTNKPFELLQRLEKIWETLVGFLVNLALGCKATFLRWSIAHCICCSYVDSRGSFLFRSRISISYRNYAIFFFSFFQIVYLN